MPMQLAKYELARFRKEAFERKLCKLIDDYSISGFVVELAQLLHDEGVTFKQTPVGLEISFGDGVTMDLEDEELLQLTGFDFETLEQCIVKKEEHA